MELASVAHEVSDSEMDFIEMGANPKETRVDVRIRRLGASASAQKECRSVGQSEDDLAAAVAATT